MQRQMINTDLVPRSRVLPCWKPKVQEWLWNWDVSKSSEILECLEEAVNRKVLVFYKAEGGAGSKMKEQGILVMRARKVSNIVACSNVKSRKCTL